MCIRDRHRRDLPVAITFISLMQRDHRLSYHAICNSANQLRSSCGPMHREECTWPECGSGPYIWLAKQSIISYALVCCGNGGLIRAMSLTRPKLPQRARISMGSSRCIGMTAPASRWGWMLLLGDLFFWTGERIKARAQYRKVLEHTPDCVEALDWTVPH